MRNNEYMIAQWGNISCADVKIDMPYALISQAAAPTGPSPPGISCQAALAYVISRQAIRGCWPYHADVVAVEQNFRKLCVGSRVVTNWGKRR